jgi:hypothetical protein
MNQLFFGVMVLIMASLYGVLAVLWSYQKALRRGEDTFLLRFVGPPLFKRLLALLFSMGSKNDGGPTLYDQRMHKAARRRYHEVANDRNATRGGGICFYGSSTFTYWVHLQDDFPDLPVFNAAFGGSCVDHILTHIEPLCTQFNPKVVVYFCGTNDLSRGRSPQTVLVGLQRFQEALHKVCPGIPIVYLSITLTPLHQFRGLSQVVQQANQLVQEFVESDSLLYYIEINDHSLAAYESLYLADGHHLNNEGHRELAMIIRPVLDRCLADQQ